MKGDQELHFQAWLSREDTMYNMGNAVSNTGVTLYGDRLNWSYYSNHFIIYKNIESLCYTLESNKILCVNYNSREKERGDFPGGPVVKNPSCIAGDAGSIPGWGTKIPRTAELPSPHVCTAAREVHVHDS